jgi:photosystem II stability/assembly factor-like uncharacterized protein
MLGPDGLVGRVWARFFQPEPLKAYPIYADEAAALAAGLKTGAVYQTATGEVRIKL